jgi:hypothetical protein
MINYIPEEYKKGFKELASLEEDVFNSILHSLDNAELGLTISQLADKVSTDFAFDKSKLIEIFTSVAALIPYLNEEEDILECVNDVVQIATKEELIKEGNPLDNRLFRLIDDRKIYYAFKITDLKTENKNIYVTSKILTDIRPIFDIDVEKIPLIGITQHTLHLHYQSDLGAPHKDFYINLTSSEISELIGVLIRADKKEETLNTIYKKAGITKLDI